MESFLCSISSHLKLMPSPRPKGIAEIVRPKCKVLYFPIDIPNNSVNVQVNSTSIEKHINYSLLNKENLVTDGSSEHKNFGSAYQNENRKRNTYDEEKLNNVSEISSSMYKSHTKTTECKDLDQDNDSQRNSTSAVLQRSKQLPENDKKSASPLPSNSSFHQEGEVLEFPVSCSVSTKVKDISCSDIPISNPLHIVWPHRW